MPKDAAPAGRLCAKAGARLAGHQDPEKASSRSISESRDASEQTPPQALKSVPAAGVAQDRQGRGPVWSQRGPWRVQLGAGGDTQRPGAAPLPEPHLEEGDLEGFLRLRQAPVCRSPPTSGSPRGFPASAQVSAGGLREEGEGEGKEAYAARLSSRGSSQEGSITKPEHKCRAVGPQLLSLQRTE